jgi:hypothetical protein
MKGLTTAEMEIKMSFPDMEKMVVEFDVVFSKQEVEKKGREIAASLDTYLLRYEHRGKGATFYFSQKAKEVVMNMEEGQEVTLVQRDVAGKVIPSLSRKGRLEAFEDTVYVTYMSGDATVRVEFEDDTASYAIYNLVFSQTDKQKEGGAQ